MSSVGEVIETARRAKGWTQEQLAEWAGMTQAALSRYENDLRSPDDDAVERIANALGVTPRLLKSGARMEGGIAVNAHMRRQATARATLWRQLEARLNLARLHASNIYEEISLRAERQVPVLDPDLVTPTDAARLVRVQWRMPLGPVRGLVDWMESAGILVIADHFGESARVDGLSQWAGDHPIVMINADVPTDRLRWTLAHELGHLVLHAHYIDFDAEDQANAFAAEFLMPADEIGPTLNRLRLGDLLELKRAWAVSLAAIIERAHTLGKISPQERASLYKMLNAKGIRRREPASDEIAPESPRLARHIGEALRDRGLAPDEVAELAGFADASSDTLFQQPTRGLRMVTEVR